VVSPTALALAIIVQAIWIPVGLLTQLDPYPFAFLLTCSNILQLILIFVLAVGQRQASTHAELRAEHDHQSISRLLYHQELQEQVLIALARKLQIEVENIEERVRRPRPGRRLTAANYRTHPNFCLLPVRLNRRTAITDYVPQKLSRLCGRVPWGT